MFRNILKSSITIRSRINKPLYNNVMYYTTNIKSTTKINEEIDHFANYDLRPEVLNNIKTRLKWKYPTTIQKKVFEHIKEDKNIVASAWTGQGKTGAYMIPLINQLINNKNVQIRAYLEETDRVDINYIRPKAIIMVPSSELARQVYKNFIEFTKGMEINIGLIINDGELKEQLYSLPNNLEVLICTPGRLLQHILYSKQQNENNYPDYPIESKDKASLLSFTRVKHFIVDECDKLLSLGYLPDVLKCWQLINVIIKSKRISDIKVMICSATIVNEVHGFILKLSPHYLLLNLNENMGVPKTIQQIRYDIQNPRKLSLLLYFLRRKGKISLKDKKTLIFVRTIQRCDRLVESLKSSGFKANALHADITPLKREKIIKNFLEDKNNIIIATDIATRGLDLPNLEYVVNYDLPHIPQDYIHRVGRCGRAGKKGVAISFVSKQSEIIKRSNGKDTIRDEQRIIKDIESILEKSKQDNHCSKLENRKIPGPFLDVDDYKVIKKIAKDPKYRDLVNYTAVKKDDVKLDKNNKVDYSELMNHYSIKDAKKKGFVISDKDRKVVLRGNKI